MGRGAGKAADPFASVFGRSRGPAAERTDLPRYCVEVLVPGRDADKLASLLRATPDSVVPGFDFEVIDAKKMRFYVRASSEIEAQELFYRVREHSTHSDWGVLAPIMSVWLDAPSS